ncbi:MAG: putative metallopeptidase [Nanoarchaeota archaeon]
MRIKYEFAPDLQNEVEDISKNLFPHVKLDRIKCFRSHGSSSRNTIARCHALGKLLQLAIGVESWYAIEFLSETFDKLPSEEKTKVMIHELMHIPKTFGGGFRHHDYVCDRNIDKLHKQYKNIKQGSFENGQGKLKDFFKW